MRAPAGGAASSEIPSPRATSEQLALARVIIERSNAARASVRAPALREVPELMKAAQDYAVELARFERLDHTSATPGRVTLTQRIEAAGGSWWRAGENLAATTGVPDVPGTVIDMWLRSPGHRANLLEKAFTTTGVGVARSYRGGWYIVQLYVLPPAKQ